MTTIAAPARSQRLARRLLGSSLAGALTTPHGVDRYVELVRPAFSLREVRAEVVAVRRATQRSVTLTLRPNANWEGFRAGQFVRLERRDRRRAAHPLLLPRVLGPRRATCSS